MKAGVAGLSEIHVTEMVRDSRTLGIKVKSDFDRKIVSDSNQLYIENLVERFGLQDAQNFTTQPNLERFLQRISVPSRSEERRVGKECA